MLDKYLLYGKLCVLGCDQQEALLSLHNNTNLTPNDIIKLTILLDNYETLNNDEKKNVLNIIKNPNDFYIFNSNTDNVIIENNITSALYQNSNLNSTFTPTSFTFKNYNFFKLLQKIDLYTNDVFKKSIFVYANNIVDKSLNFEYNWFYNLEKNKVKFTFDYNKPNFTIKAIKITNIENNQIVYYGNGVEYFWHSNVKGNVNFKIEVIGYNKSILLQKNIFVYDLDIHPDLQVHDLNFNNFIKYISCNHIINSKILKITKQGIKETFGLLEADVSNDECKSCNNIIKECEYPIAYNIKPYIPNCNNKYYITIKDKCLCDNVCNCSNLIYYRTQLHNFNNILNICIPLHCLPKFPLELCKEQKKLCYIITDENEDVLLKDYLEFETDVLLENTSISNSENFNADIKTNNPIYNIYKPNELMRMQTSSCGCS